MFSLFFFLLLLTQYIRNSILYTTLFGAFTSIISIVLHTFICVVCGLWNVRLQHVSFEILIRCVYMNWPILHGSGGLMTFSFFLAFIWVRKTLQTGNKNYCTSRTWYLPNVCYVNVHNETCSRRNSSEGPPHIILTQTRFSACTMKTYDYLWRILRRRMWGSVDLYFF